MITTESKKRRVNLEWLAVVVLLVLALTATVTNADDIVAYWPLDEGTGSVAHDALGNYDGDLVGDPTWISPGQVGAGALDFGSGNYVNCGTGVTTAPDMTVAFWMKADGHGYQRPLACSAGDYSTAPGWIVMLRLDLPPYSPPGGVWFRIHGTGWFTGPLWWASGDLQINETVYEADTWVHMAFTFDEDTDTLSGYINGEPAGVTVLPEGRSVANTANDLRFGSNTGWLYEWYSGMLDEIAIWDKALTAPEVETVYLFGPTTELLESLAEKVIELELPKGISNSLNAKLDTALRALEDLNENNDVAAVNSLGAFINAVEAQRGKKITNDQADELIAAAQQIIDILESG